jgi:glutamate/aspartate transport system substrate-binding protein
VVGWVALLALLSLLSTPLCRAAAPPAAAPTPTLAAAAAATPTNFWDPAADPLPPPAGRRLRLGVQRGAAPFAFEREGASGDFRGYSVDVCLRIVQMMRQDMGLDFQRERDVEFVPVTSKTRFVLLLAGKIDMECGSTSNTEERRKMPIAFTPTIFVSDVAVLVSPQASRASQTLGTLLQFLSQNKLALVATEGSTSAKYARGLVDLAAGKPRLVYGADHKDSFRKLRTGEAHAMVLDRALLATELKTDARLSQRGFALPVWSPVPGQLECYGIMTRGLVFGAFGQRVRAKLDQMRAQGVLKELHDRWFVLPLGGDMLLPKMQAGQALGINLHPEFEMVLLDPQRRPCAEVALGSSP